LQFQERGQLFIRWHNEPLSVARIRVTNNAASTSMATKACQLAMDTDIMKLK